MEKGLTNIRKICLNCKKEFIISSEEQKEALARGGELTRDYCLDCLKKWKEGEIDLNKKN